MISVGCFFQYSFCIEINVIFLDVSKDILDRALNEPYAEPRPLDGSVTNQHSASQLQDPLPSVTSPCESMATVVGVAERALTQSAELRRGLDALLSPTDE